VKEFSSCFCHGKKKIKSPKNWDLIFFLRRESEYPGETGIRGAGGSVQFIFNVCRELFSGQEPDDMHKTWKIPAQSQDEVEQKLQTQADFEKCSQGRNKY